MDDSFGIDFSGINTNITNFRAKKSASSTVDSVAVSKNDTEISDESGSVAKKTHQSSLRQEGDIFGIPLFINDNTDPEVLKITRETFIRLLDTNNNGKPDDPELIEFMIKDNCKVIVLRSRLDFDDLDDDFDSDASIAIVASCGILLDDFVTELLELITSARTQLLTKKAMAGDEKAMAGGCNTAERCH